MDARRFQEIKDRIEDAKTMKARAEGAKEKLEQRWKRDFGLNSVEDVKKEISRLQGLIAKDEEKLSTLYAEIDKVTEWDKV